MWSASTAQGRYRPDTICSTIFALDSKAWVHPNSQGGELLNYKKSIQFLKLDYTSQQLPLVSTAAPFLPLLLLSGCSSVPLRGHPEHSPLASPTGGCCSPCPHCPSSTGFFLPPPVGTHSHFGFSTPPFYARYPPKQGLFQ